MSALRQNLRYGARALRRSPGFTAVAAFTLALGIGATTAIFALIDSIVLEPLPYAASERLVSINHPVPGLNPDWEWGLSSGGYFHFRENAQSLESLGIYSAARLTLAGAGTAEEVAVARATASLFTVLRTRPLHGRLITRDENETPGAAVAVLGHGFWRNHFGEDPGVVGTTIELEGRPVEVVGVAEPGFRLPGRDVDVWVPAFVSPSMDHVNSHGFQAIARLADGSRIEAAQAELDRLTARLDEAVPTAYAGGFLENSRFSTVVRPLRQQVVGDFDRVLWILLGAVGVVLLIAAGNVANLFFVRMEGRRREVAVRSALGAGRAQLTGHYLTESLLLALLAGLVGLGLADAGIQLLLAMAPPDVPRLSEVGLGPDAVLFGMGLALLVGIGFGLIPALRKADDHRALRDSGRGLTASRARNLVRGSLVVGQVALALILLTAAGLLLETFRNLRAVDAGIRADNVLTVQVSLPSGSYPDYASVGAFHQEVAAGIARLPGVEQVGAIQSVPLDGGYDGGCNLVMPEGWNPQAERYPCVHTPRVTPGFFPTLGIGIDGREPDWREAATGQAGAIVSRAFAERYWPGEDPLTKRITAYSGNQPYFQVVGVAEDVRAAGLDEPPVEAVYFPVVPAEGIVLWSPPRGMTLVIRTATERPQELTAAVRGVIAEADPAAAVGNVATMERVVAGHRSVARVAFAMLLLGIAAAIALVLGAVGLYGVVAYVVGQRTGEIGLRMALGARAGQVGGLVVKQSLVLTATGIGVGLVGALAVTRVLQSLLFEVSPTDPGVLVAVAALLVAITLIASFAPARRATRVDPMTALRTE